MSLPYAGLLIVRPPGARVVPEPPRRGEDGGEPCRICAGTGLAPGGATSTSPCIHPARAACPAPCGWRAGCTSTPADWASPLVRTGPAFASLGSLLALLAGVGRTGLAMARAGDLPRRLARVSPVQQVPDRIQIVLAGVVIGLVLTADLRGVIGFSSFGVLVYYGIANAAAYTQLTGHRRWPRPIQVLGLLGCMALVVTLPWPSIKPIRPDQTCRWLAGRPCQIAGMRLSELATVKPVADLIGEATGRRHRTDPVLPRTGGPAGNAALTAWTGLTLLVLSVAELLTLFNVTGLISWHVAIGALLIPPALLKTGSTGWRIVGYYRGAAPYRQAGPPSTAMRLLGPLVVLSTLALLGSGVLLVLLGQQSARQVIVTVVGFRIDYITLHQASFAVWATATGLHLLGRIFPALRLTFLADPGRRVPGTTRRISVLVVTAAVAALLAVVLVGAEGDWGHDDHGAGQHGQRPRLPAGER